MASLTRAEKISMTGTFLASYRASARLPTLCDLAPLTATRHACKKLYTSCTHVVQITMSSISHIESCRSRMRLNGGQGVIGLRYRIVTMPFLDDYRTSGVTAWRIATVLQAWIQMLFRTA